jgi:uronate dehydrogenase
MDCIVLTGAAGRLGRWLRPSLAAACRELRLVDVQRPEVERPGETVHRFDLNDEAALARVMEGADAVVHFAGYPREAGWDVLVPANITSAARLWEAALQAGVDRIVYASSNHAIGMYPRSQTLDAASPPRPDSNYGVTKVFMEALAQMHADKHGLRGFGIRIGRCETEPVDARTLASWIHPDDLAQLVGVGLRADYEHEIVYGASRNRLSWWDNRRAYALGYAPAHSADAFVDRLAGHTSGDTVAEACQGGSYASQGFTHPRRRPG